MISQKYGDRYNWDDGLSLASVTLPDKELNRHVYLGVKSKEESEERKLNELQEVARNAFSVKSTLSMNELTQTLMDTLQVKNRMARNYIKFMKDHQIIEKLPENSGEFRMVL